MTDKTPRAWDDALEQEFYTPEEIAASDARVGEVQRERVIEGLQKCAALHQGFICESCEYPVDDCAVDDAIAMLKARESMRPGLGKIHHDDGSVSYFLHCPFDGTTLVGGDNYCRTCGRAVKWE